MIKILHKTIALGICLLTILFLDKAYAQQDALRVELVNPNIGNYVGGIIEYKVEANSPYTIDPNFDVFEWELPAYCHLVIHQIGFPNRTMGNIAKVAWDLDISPDKNFTFGIGVSKLGSSYSSEQNQFYLNNIININDLKSITPSSTPVRYFLDFPLAHYYYSYSYSFDGDGVSSATFTYSSQGDYVDVIWNASSVQNGFEFKVVGHYGHLEQVGPQLEFVEDATDILDFKPTSNKIEYSLGGATTINVECGTSPTGTIGEAIQSPNGTLPIQSYQWQIEELGTTSFVDIPSETSSNFGYSIPITSSSLLRRRVILSDGTISFSNIITINITLNNFALENRNLTREHNVLVPNIKNACEVLQLPIGARLQTTTYLDGFGRTIQINGKQVSEAANGEWKDMVSHFDYSADNRKGFVSRSYIPFQSTTNDGLFTHDAAELQKSFVRQYFNEPNTAPTYSEVITDNSPLNRSVKVFNPGDEWGGKNIGVSNVYDVNKTDDLVAIYNYDLTQFTNSYPNFSGYYDGGTLFKNISIDEKGKSVITFTDFNRNTILKRVQYDDAGNWADTYYVYDDLGQLRITIPPKAVDYLIANNYDFSKMGDELLFLNEYDYRGRLIIKKQPSQQLTDASVLVYDKRNRVVATQDGVQRKQGLWGFALYDGLNREIATGNFTTPVTTTRTNIQDDVNAAYNGAGFDVSEFSCNLLFDNTNQVFFKAAYPIVIDDNTSPYPLNTYVTNIVFNSLNSYSSYNSGVETIGYNAPTFTFPNNPSPYSTPDNANKTGRLCGMVTNQITRVLDYSSTNRKFLRSTIYYDEKGRAIQTLSDNIKDGIDVVNNQYDFMGKTLATHLKHEINGGAVTFKTISQPTYDNLGRLINLKRNYDNKIVKELASYSYDAYGRLKTKVLDPAYTNTTRIPNPPLTGMETLNYEYNVNGWLTYINKDYVKSTDNTTQWNNYFGLQLGYEDKGNEFANKQYNGQLTGVMWRSQGTNNNTKFDFSYDNMGRLTDALYNEKNDLSINVWNTDKTNNYSTNISYADKNGNIGTLKNYGLLPGSNKKIFVDNLLYDYGVDFDKTNKLHSVSDGTTITVNGQINDFVDGNNVAQDDYAYDENGNVIQDYNKKTTTNGIEYDLVLNKPRKMTLVDGFGNMTYIEYLYDASGAKLSKAVTNGSTSTTKTTYYIGSFVYEDDGTGAKLQYVLHEEGRMKIMEDKSGTFILNTAAIFEKCKAGENNTEYADLNSTLNTNPPNPNIYLQGCFEFFIKDQLGNTRMVLTEEQHKEKYKANFNENTLNSFEAEFFGQINNGTPYDPNGFDLTQTANTRYTNNEYANSITHISSSIWADPTYPVGTGRDVCKLSANTNKIGPNQLLKVMAGDKINSTVKYLYQADNNTGNSGSQANNIISNIVNTLLGLDGAKSVGDVVKGQTNGINNLLSGNTSYIGIVNTKPNDGNTTNFHAPYAYLNVLFFDEQFNFIEPDPNDLNKGTRFKRVKIANVEDILSITTKAPQNGYVYIYLSNESDEPVYFDDFINSIDRSRITQETHYYPFGQKIAGLSSTVYGKLPNKYNYQGDNCEEEPETGYDEFSLRFYDPTIGRWLAVDPYDEFGSPYVGMGNNPVDLTDPSGGGIDWFRNLFTNEERWADSESELDGSDWINLNKPSPFSFVKNPLLSDGSEGLEGVTVYTTRILPKSREILEKTGKVFDGIGKAVFEDFIYGTIKGVGNFVDKASNAQGQAELVYGVKNAIVTGMLADPVTNNPASGLLNLYIANKYDMISNGSIEDKSRAITGIVTDFGSLFIGGEFTGTARTISTIEKTSIIAVEKGSVKYLGRLDDLIDIPRSQTILDELPNLGTPKANYYQNMSVVRRNLREGVTFKDASWKRLNSEPAPTKKWPTRTVGQTFYGAERNLMKNRGLWPK